MSVDRRQATVRTPPAVGTDARVGAILLASLSLCAGCVTTAATAVLASVPVASQMWRAVRPNALSATPAAVPRILASGAVVPDAGVAWERSIHYSDGRALITDPARADAEIVSEWRIPIAVRAGVGAVVGLGADHCDGGEERSTAWWVTPSGAETSSSGEMPGLEAWRVRPVGRSSSPVERADAGARGHDLDAVAAATLLTDHAGVGGPVRWLVTVPGPGAYTLHIRGADGAIAAADATPCIRAWRAVTSSVASAALRLGAARDGARADGALTDSLAALPDVSVSLGLTGSPLFDLARLDALAATREQTDRLETTTADSVPDQVLLRLRADRLAPLTSFDPRAGSAAERAALCALIEQTTVATERRRVWHDEPTVPAGVASRCDATGGVARDPAASATSGAP